MAAHSWWRINISANDGDVSFLAIAEAQMHTSVGGADVCAGGTPSASSADAAAPVVNAFDNDAATRWSTPSGTITGWLAYQFAAPVDIVEYSIQAHPTTPARSPKNFLFEYSDNGALWINVDARTGQSGWTNGQTRTFAVTPVSSGAAKPIIVIAT